MLFSNLKIFKMHGVGILLLLCILVFSCGGWSDLLLNMGSGYYYDGEGPSSNMIFLSYSEKDSSIDEMSVYPTVKNFAYDEEFVIATQVPDKEGIMARVFKFVDPSFEVKLDSLIQNDPYFNNIFANDTNYWIIDKARHIVLGPYNKIDFAIKSKELNISKKLIKDFDKLN
ncbi:hypothetical protein AGMMS50262_23120 [Bacteroidia bacterium]|nr:hypothetical protein AGMMS50262_23120 [Bacteroidia bacterium]